MGRSGKEAGRALRLRVEERVVEDMSPGARRLWEARSCTSQGSRSLGRFHYPIGLHLQNANSKIK